MKKIPVRIQYLAVLVLVALAACAPTAPPPTATPTFFPIIPTPEVVASPTATATLFPLLIPTSPAPTASTGAYRVLEGSNCRADPDTDADLLLTFSPDTIVEVSGRSTDGKWLQVSALEVDRLCWIASDLVVQAGTQTELVPLPAAAAGESIRFQAANVTHCRQGPDILYRIDTVLDKGATAQVLGRNQTSDWYLLLMEDGIIRCWVSARLGSVNGAVESIQPMTMFRLDSQAFCREGPATYYDAATSYIPKRYFIIQGRSVDNRWLWIERNRVTEHCWLANSLGVVDGSLDTIPVMTALDVRSTANCRSGPGTLYPVVKQVMADTVVAVSGQSPAGKWLYTVMPDGVQRCWISADAGPLPATLEEVPVVAPPAEPSPLLIMTASGQCRTGPSADYSVRAGFDLDKVLLITGRNADSTWWQVQNPTTGPDCWVWGALGTIHGSTDAIPVVSVPLP